jgi:hypothetical protein
MFSLPIYPVSSSSWMFETSLPKVLGGRGRIEGAYGLRFEVPPMLLRVEYEGFTIF